MAFGWSVSDIALLVRLAYKTTQGARAACGEYDELTRETYALHVILQRLRDEADKPRSFINRPGETYKQELESISSGCQHVLTQLDKILEKYNALSDQEKSFHKLWKQVRFGSGAVADVADLRSKITSYTATLSVFINLVSMKTVGEVERQMNRAGGDLRDIKIAVNGITASLSASAAREGSVFTAYTNDDKDAWRELRRGLMRQGFRDELIRRHMKTIMAYVKELGTRGILDDINDHESREASRKPGNETDVYQIEEGTYNSPGSIRTKIKSSSPDQIESNSLTVDLSKMTSPILDGVNDYESREASRKAREQEDIYQNDEAICHSSSNIPTKTTSNSLDQIDSKSPTVDVSPITASTYPDLSSSLNSKTNDLPNISHQPYVESASDCDSDSDNAQDHVEQVELCSTSPQHPDMTSHDAAELARQNSGFAEISPSKEPSTDSEEGESYQGLTYCSWYTPGMHPRKASDTATDARIVTQPQITGTMKMEALNLGTCTCKDTQIYKNLLRELHAPHFISDGRVVSIMPLYNLLNTVQRFHALVKSLLETCLPDMETRGVDGGEVYDTREETLKSGPEDPEEISSQESLWEFEEYILMCLDILSQMAAICKECEGAEPVLTTLRTITSDQVAALCVDFITKYERRSFDLISARREEATWHGYDDLTAKIRAWCHGSIPVLRPPHRPSRVSAGGFQCNFPMVNEWCVSINRGYGMFPREGVPEERYCAFHDRPLQASRFRAFGETSTISQYYLQAFQPRPDDPIPYRDRR